MLKDVNRLLQENVANLTGKYGDKTRWYETVLRTAKSDPMRFIGWQCVSTSLLQSGIAERNLNCPSSTRTSIRMEQNV